MKNLTLPKLKFIKYLNNITRYIPMLIFIAYSLLIGMVIYYADVYSKYEPSITQVNNKKESLSSKKVDESAINKLKELEARNISLESLFDNGRTNPFEN